MAYRTFEHVVLALLIIAFNIAAVRVTRSMTNPRSNGRAAAVAALAGRSVLIIALLILVGAAWAVAALFTLDTTSSIGIALLLGLVNVGWLFKNVATRNL
ncbi:hypothetical protein [Burkholderia vietnamiensis]|uniref:hypothetical protein n=1 Tax=Burkholderia vietnamiensis TaxID=60552 RepID=UPI0015941130|nr:hypothetical protein [Burkholderia vietnamiensis]